MSIYICKTMAKKTYKRTIIVILPWFSTISSNIYFILYAFTGCRFRGERGEEKFVRLKEDAPKGSEAFRISAFPRSGFNIQALDGVSATRIIIKSLWDIKK